jgi:parvulin-like peptidyl-prolyl isomerase
MPAIVDRALETPAGQVSQPFDSSQAVHLIRVLAIEPGQRTLEEAKEDVRKHMLLFLLEFLAKSSAQEMPLVWQAK